MRLVAAFVAALALAAPALASEQHPTLAELEPQIMCLVCHETLDQSDSPFATRLKTLIAGWIAEGATTSEIKARLVAQFGKQILAAPPKRGFDLLAWLLPPVGIVAGAIVLGALAWRWSRGREPPGPVPALAGGLDPELERRLDEELERFDA